MKANRITTVDDYLDLAEEPARSTLIKMRATIRSLVPKDAIEKVSYQIPSFFWNGPLVGFAAFKEHCSFFVMHGSLLEQFQQELKGYSTSKGTIRFPTDKPLPTALVKKLVKAKLAIHSANLPMNAAKAVPKKTAKSRLNS
jgi:uncharacterized protein YdhG (YjbR/CyaY superfamily)